MIRVWQALAVVLGSAVTVVVTAVAWSDPDPWLSKNGLVRIVVPIAGPAWTWAYARAIALPTRRPVTDHLRELLTVAVAVALAIVLAVGGDDSFRPSPFGRVALVAGAALVLVLLGVYLWKPVERVPGRSPSLREIWRPVELPDPPQKDEPE